MQWLGVFFFALAATSGLEPGTHHRGLEVDDYDRPYYVHVPKSYDGSKAYPVVLAFHGGGANAESMQRFCGLNEKAEEAGFLAVYPSGTGLLRRVRTFNAGNCCGYAMRKDVDDVKYVRELLEDLAKAAKIDPKRIYATGMSNGGMISYRLASELSDRIAAIAPVGGPMGTKTCHPKRPVPVMHFHGTDDAFAAFEGGPGKRSRTQTDFYSVEHSVNAWVKANGCDPQPKVTQLPDKAEDGMTVVRKVYGGGKDGSEVILIQINGGGHTWPGREPPLKFLGPSTQDISANDLMWEFFKRHPMK